jgi:hypothetical protein
MGSLTRAVAQLVVKRGLGHAGGAPRHQALEGVGDRTAWRGDCIVPDAQPDLAGSVVRRALDAERMLVIQLVDGFPFGEVPG